jgi:hypothetical protein
MFKSLKRVAFDAYCLTVRDCIQTALKATPEQAETVLYAYFDTVSSCRGIGLSCREAADIVVRNLRAFGQMAAGGSRSQPTA